MKKWLKMCLCGALAAAAVLGCFGMVGCGDKPDDEVPSGDRLDIYVKGAYITGWDHKTDEEYKMEFDARQNVYTYSHEFVAGDSFVFYNFVQKLGDDGEYHTTIGEICLNSDFVDRENSDTAYLDLAPKSNIGVTASGTYSFTYVADDQKLEILYNEAFSGYEPSDTWYVAGSGITEPLKSSSFGNNLTDKQKLQKTADLTYEITLDLARGDLFQIVMNKSYGGQHTFDDIVDPQKDDVTYFARAGDGNNVRVEKSGNYTLTLTLDAQSPLGDKVKWVRNGDIEQELPVAYDVFMKKQPDDGSDTWEISERHKTGANGAEEGVTVFHQYFIEGSQFCFIYYEPGVPDENVGSPFDPGMLITGAMLGSEGVHNGNFSTYANDFVCKKAGFYTISIDFNGDGVSVDFVDYKENIPEFDVIVKGSAIKEGWDGWKDGKKTPSHNAKAELIVEFIHTGLGTGEFGFAWWDETTEVSYGNWIGVKNMGVSGDSNDLFVSDENANNFVASVTGTYRVVIDMSTGKPVVDFYAMA